MENPELWINGAAAEDLLSIIFGFVKSRSLEPRAQQALRNSLQECLAVLSEKERKALDLRYGLSGRVLKYRELATELNIRSESRARGLVLKALHKMRHPILSRRIRLFAELMDLRSVDSDRELAIVTELGANEYSALTLVLPTEQLGAIANRAAELKVSSEDLICASLESLTAVRNELG